MPRVVVPRENDKRTSLGAFSRRDGTMKQQRFGGSPMRFWLSTREQGSKAARAGERGPRILQLGIRDVPESQAAGS
jgi:hypothetical protein